MDEADLAQQSSDFHLNLALQKHRGRSNSGELSSHCDDCGDKIPAARRRALPGCRRCVGCQQAAETGGGSG
jgi:phage/conjugal plasmid C-4 type zinc finger TraR family protein